MVCVCVCTRVCSADARTPGAAAHADDSGLRAGRPSLWRATLSAVAALPAVVQVRSAAHLPFMEHVLTESASRNAATRSAQLYPMSADRIDTLALPTEWLRFERPGRVDVLYRADSKLAIFATEQSFIKDTDKAARLESGDVRLVCVCVCVCVCACLGHGCGVCVYGVGLVLTTTFTASPPWC